jgi:catechol 2,3-dioxygenase-like lactoylglutathione lyase family enzyme
MKLRQLIPMLNVSDIKLSLSFYKEAFDFDIVSDTTGIDK